MRLPVATAQETRALEAELIEGWGMPPLLLMERAALAVAALVRAIAGNGPLEVLAGPGHNGADGAAVARMLAQAGRRVRVRVVGEPGALARQQLDWADRAGAARGAWDEPYDPTAVVVDALYGFGLNRPLKGEAAQAVMALNASRVREVVAVDLPSGLDPDTGTPWEPCVRATRTVATGVLKLGTLADPALDMVGELWLADIGLRGTSTRAALNAPDPLPPRAPATHKGSAGYALAIAGSEAMGGAAILVAEAAGRAGAGVVMAAVPDAVRESLLARVPEALAIARPPHGVLDTLDPWLRKCRAALAGPGLGSEGKDIGLALWRTWPGALVLDADALVPELLDTAPAGEPILTPHPGEAARMLRTQTETLQRDRAGAASELARRARAWVVLKGARTVVASPEGSLWIEPHGTPALATGGSGDVLGGVLMALLAQGLDPGAAARTGVALHAHAGAIAACRRDSRGVVARDVAEALPQAFDHLHERPSWGSDGLMRVTPPSPIRLGS